MKSYVLALLLIIILLVAGCGAQKTSQSQTSQQTSAGETATAETPVLDEATDVDTVEENLSPPDSTEDDYGDII